MLLAVWDFPQYGSISVFQKAGCMQLKPESEYFF
jgi:hypothetical protein